MSRTRKLKLPAAAASKITDARKAVGKAEADVARAKFWLEVAAQSLTEAATLADKKRGAR